MYGLLTAGHCPEQLTYRNDRPVGQPEHRSDTLLFVIQVVDGDQDLQWHITTNLVPVGSVMQSSDYESQDKSHSREARKLLLLQCRIEVNLTPLPSRVPRPPLHIRCERR